MVGPIAVGGGGYSGFIAAVIRGVIAAISIAGGCGGVTGAGWLCLGAGGVGGSIGEKLRTSTSKGVVGGG